MIFFNLFLVFAAGLVSVASPCVLPIIPIVIAGRKDDHKLRPILIIAGLTTAFVTMGVISALFGSLIGSSMIYVEKVAAIAIVILGLLLLLNQNPFKHLSFISQLGQKSRGRFGGYLLGFTLGVIWIPCVGPMLSGVLAMVATQGKLLSGTGLLLIYALGFSVPLLIAAYASHFFRARIRAEGKFPHLVNAVSGLLPIALGVFIYLKGMVGFGF